MLVSGLNGLGELGNGLLLIASGGVVAFQFEGHGGASLDLCERKVQ